MRGQDHGPREAVAATQDYGLGLSRRRVILVVVGVMLGMLLAALDQTVVGTAMPRVIADLNGMEHYAWVFTAYMLTSTVTVPIYGKLSDTYGRRIFFLVGMGFFLLGSALSGTSQDMTQLIIYRGIQGLGAGAMMPISQAIVGDLFSPMERGKWQGVMMSVFGLASILGPTAGGWITDNMGWRWVFYVNMPVGALALVAAGLVLPGRTRRQSHQIDYTGAATLIAGTVPLLLAFTWGGTQYAWGSPEIIGLFGFAIVMLAAFLVIEMRSAEPIISPALFRNSIFTVSTIVSFLVSAGMFGAIMYIPLFIQGVIGESATNSGAVLTPMMLSFIFSSIIAGQIMSRTGRYKVLALVALAVGSAGSFLLSQMDTSTTTSLVVRNMVVSGVGIGVMMSLFTIVVQNAFPRALLGQVTASLQFFRSIGGTIGVAVFSTFMMNGFQSTFQQNLPQVLKQTIPPAQLAAMQNPQVLLAPGATAKLQESFTVFGPQGLEMFRQLMDTIRLSLSSAIGSVFLVGTGVMVLSLISCLFLREIPLRKSHREVARPKRAEAEVEVALS